MEIINLNKINLGVCYYKVKGNETSFYRNEGNIYVYKYPPIINFFIRKKISKPSYTFLFKVDCDIESETVSKMDLLSILEEQVIFLNRKKEIELKDFI